MGLETGKSRGFLKYLHLIGAIFFTFWMCKVWVVHIIGPNLSQSFNEYLKVLEADIQFANTLCQRILRTSCVILASENNLDAVAGEGTPSYEPRSTLLLLETCSLCILLCWLETCELLILNAIALGLDV
ncbi:hypothetical protein C1H46_010208 [Malus baccata]|uniref:Uncharacterized protein n=1 Tax=Malus baccata TaxID=106549 RepID=A0A540MZL0_MALBA|nr:hypothetical protein C1H46_010208 [Malus baccata]